MSQSAPPSRIDTLLPEPYPFGLVPMLRVVVILCLTSLALVAVGVAVTPGSSRADFVYAAAAGLNTLDPAQMSWTKDLRIAINIWEGLAAHHPQTTEPVEGAAHFPPAVSSNGLTYQFTIRSDARWSNGAPVKAADFVRGWRRAVEPGTARDYSGLLLDNIAGLREYYDWRSRAVAVLTALSRLADGWPIDAEAAATLDHTAQPAELVTIIGRVRTPDFACCDFYAALAERLSETETDWPAIHLRYLRQHAAECDKRFARTGIAAVDDSTLRVTLDRPCPYFLDLCAFPTFMPIHESIELLREDFRGTGLTEEGLVVYDQQWTKPDYRARGYPGLITNGPYRLTEWSFKRRVRLVRNPFHHDHDRIACDTIDRVVYSDANTAVMAYEAGDVDFLPGMEVHYDHKLIELAEKGLRPDFHNPTVLATHFYVFNCRDEEVLGQPNPFTDARVRRAFNLAVDKRLLVEKVLGRGEPVSDHLVPVGAIRGYNSPPALGYDPAEARRLLAEAGYPGGTGLPAIDLLYKTTGVDEKTCQVLARMWRDTLGARVALRGKEPKTFAEDKVHRRYMIARAGWYGDYNDPTTFLDVFRSDNGNNDAGYDNPVYDDLLDRAADVGSLGLPPSHTPRGAADLVCSIASCGRRTRVCRHPQGVTLHWEEGAPSLAQQGVGNRLNLQTLTERMALLARAESILIRNDCPLLPLYQHTNLMAIKPYVAGLYPNRRLIFPFRYVTVDR